MYVAKQEKGWIGRNAWVAGLLAAAALGACGWAVATHFSGKPSNEVVGAPAKAWFMDMETGALFVGPGVYERLPMVNPGNGGDQVSSARATGVLAHVFSCGDCADEKKRFVGFLETHDANTLAVEPVLIAAVNDTTGKLNWVGQGTEEGARIEAKARAKCPAGEIKTCRPE